MLDEGRFIVETVDVITPVVNDPFAFGGISAANSLSDIYAMGGRPLTALAVLGYSSCDYESAVVREIMRGAIETLRQAGAALIGGHSFEDQELKFGLSVTGTIRRESILRSRGSRPGDLIVMTKPIGTGVLATALKGRKLGDEDLSQAVRSMLTLNDRASEAALQAGATSATDVTGFGLLGHASSMIRGSSVDFEIRLRAVPVFDRVRDLIAQGMAPEGAYNNMRFVAEGIDQQGLPEEELLLLADPQTSGGLLITLPEGSLGAFEESCPGSSLIGRVIEGRGRIRLI
jgi:selenide,water dikinase